MDWAQDRGEIGSQRGIQLTQKGVPEFQVSKGKHDVITPNQAPLEDSIFKAELTNDRPQGSRIVVDMPVFCDPKQRMYF